MASSCFPHLLKDGSRNSFKTNENMAGYRLGKNFFREMLEEDSVLLQNYMVVFRSVIS